MEDMSPAELRAFLLDAPRTGKCAVVRRDGRPHVTPIWFDLDGDDWLFTTHESSIKGRSIRRDGRVSICVDDERPPFSYVTVEGRAAASEDLDELRRWAARIGGRYMGAENAEAYGRRNGVPGELLVRVTPSHVVAKRGIAD